MDDSGTVFGGLAMLGLESPPEMDDWKAEQVLEKAKRLSVNAEFQAALAAFRERWHITAHLPESGASPIPQFVWRDYTSHITDSFGGQAGESPGAKDGETESVATVRGQLEVELHELARRFGLDALREDYGLLVAAVCYGLTPDLVINHWPEILRTAWLMKAPGVEIFVDNQYFLTEWLVNQLGIGFLVRKLGGVDPDWPDPVREVIDEALAKAGPAELAEKVAAQILFCRGSPTTPNLLVQIQPETTFEDLRRAWRTIEEWRTRYLAKPQKDTRKWRNYERDVFVRDRVKREGLTYEAAYDEWLKSHPYEEPLELTALIKAVSRMEQA